MKEKYRNWYDNEKNDRRNSPIFKKVNFDPFRCHICLKEQKNKISLFSCPYKKPSSIHCIRPKLESKISKTLSKAQSAKILLYTRKDN
jgi:hypothetical protein